MMETYFVLLIFVLIWSLTNALNIQKEEKRSGSSLRGLITNGSAVAIVDEQFVIFGNKKSMFGFTELHRAVLTEEIVGKSELIEFKFVENNNVILCNKRQCSYCKFEGRETGNQNCVILAKIDMLNVTVHQNGDLLYMKIHHYPNKKHVIYVFKYKNGTYTDLRSIGYFGVKLYGKMKNPKISIVGENKSEEKKTLINETKNVTPFSDLKAGDAPYFEFYNNQMILVKTYNNTMNQKEVENEKEMLNSVKHKNIVKFLGLEELGDKILLVTEYMNGGDLHTFLTSNNRALTVSTVFEFCFQIIDAMIFLHDKEIVHGNLTSKNCLLQAGNSVVKLADYGLSRKLRKKHGESNRKENFRWAPLEILEEWNSRSKRITKQYDIWSFGIILWEMLERQVPYKNLNTSDEVFSFLNTGERLKCFSCPVGLENLYNLCVLECWDHVPKKRPTFTAMKKKIQKIHEESNRLNLLNTEIELPHDYEVSRK